jgi:Protein of unknown function (DUF3486)
MPPRSKVVTMVPAHIREEIDRRLLANGFSDYEGLAQWVRSQGYEISDDSLWRYGRNLQQDVTAAQLTMRQARALAAIAGGDEALMGQALMTIAQQKALETLVDMEEVKPAALNAVANLMRSVIAQQRWAFELKTRSGQQNRVMAKQPNTRPQANALVRELQTLALQQQLQASATATIAKPDRADPHATPNTSDEPRPAAEPQQQRMCIAAENGSAPKRKTMPPDLFASVPHQASPRIAADHFVLRKPATSPGLLGSLSDIASIVAPPHLQALRSQDGTAESGSPNAPARR